EGWASESDLAPGYARVPYKYIADNCRSAFVATGAAAQPEPVQPQPTPQPTPTPQPVQPKPQPEPPKPAPKPGNNSVIDWIRKLLGGK
ncbi:MAG: hypothetical protein KDH08_18135, partial [Anaerolineae bacterium]|nr:hypothetical protein [Anaerolineae bacterium]